MRPLSLAESATGQNDKMRRHVLQLGAFLLLLVCVCGQVTETFDFWDHTLQTGNDVEYSLVAVALIVGASFGVAHVVAIVMRTASRTSWLLSPFIRPSRCALPPVVSTGYSPPEPLRI